METDLDKVLYYDPSSASGLRWKVERRTGKDGRILLKRPGDEAGSKIKSGYWQVQVDRKSIHAHRVIMLLSGFDLKGMQVDHKDGVGLNNNMSNLRVVSVALNKRNLKKHFDSYTLKTGVTFEISRHGFTMAVASWYDGVCLKKRFSVRKYGLLPAFAKACAARDEAIANLNSRGFGYTERHGK